MVLINYSEVKIQIQSMMLDLKRTTGNLGSRVIKIMDQEVYIRDDDGALVGKLRMRNHDSTGIIHESFRFRNSYSSDLEWINVDIRKSAIVDQLYTHDMMLKALISYGEQLILHWENYPVSSGYTDLIHQSLITGAKIRIAKCRHWLEIRKDDDSFNEVYVDIDSHIICTISWNFPWIKEQSRVYYHSDAANVTQIFIKQAISHLSDTLKRNVFAIHKEVKKIELAASTTPDNYDIINHIKSNLFDICTEINELVSTILIEISKSQGIPEEWTRDVSILITSIQVQILPFLALSSHASQCPFGKILYHVTSSVQELVLRVERLLKIQLLYLTESPYDGRLIKRSWWSGLLYEKEFLDLLQLISLSVQKMIQNFIDMGVSVELFQLIFGNGFLFTLYSDLMPDVNSIGIFEDLQYRLHEIRKRIKIRFHSFSDFSDVKFKINSLYLTMSFPINDQAYSQMIQSNLKHPKMDIIPLFFLLKSEPSQRFWSDNIEEKKVELTTRINAINDSTMKLLETYIQKLKHFEISNNSKAKCSLGNNIDLSLKLLKTEITGTEANLSYLQKPKETHLTSLANHCINAIGRSLAANYTSNRHDSLLTGIWLQDKLSKSTFHHETVDYMKESFGILIDRDWSQE